MQHLLDLGDLTQDDFLSLLDAAQSELDQPATGPCLQADSVLANLFMEPSTRTRVSMEIAAARLGMSSVSLDLARASTVKGETDEDTVRTLLAQGVRLFAVRSADPGVPAELADVVGGRAGIINCGEAHLNHPTQGLLDALTLRQRRPEPAACRALIVGDLAHSRVARSAVQAFRLLGVEDIALAGPAQLMPDDAAFLDLPRFGDLDEAVAGRDVIMMLRIQVERMSEDVAPDRASYHATWGLTEARLAGAAEDVIVMHPGPFNRGVELSDAVVDGPRSVIWDQVANGVAVRMAVMRRMLGVPRG